MQTRKGWLTAVGLIPFVLQLTEATAASPDAGKPIVLDKGVHPLLDDYLVARAAGVER